MCAAYLGMTSEVKIFPINGYYIAKAVSSGTVGGSDRSGFLFCFVCSPVVALGLFVQLGAQHEFAIVHVLPGDAALLSCRSIIT